MILIGLNSQYRLLYLEVDILYNIDFSEPNWENSGEFLTWELNCGDKLSTGGQFHMFLLFVNVMLCYVMLCYCFDVLCQCYVSDLFFRFVRLVCSMLH